jgi:pilus assembly protein CpaB
MAIFSSLSATRKRMLLAVVCGVLAALLIGLYAGDLQAQAASSRAAALAEYGGERVEVLVAARNIAAGETLSADNATMQPWLADLLPDGAFTAADAAYGQVVNAPVYRNEPLAKAKIADGSQRLEVPEGLCALSIPVSDEMAVGGAIVIGSAVNVYAVGDTVVSLVAANVLVLESSNGYGDSGSADAAGGFFAANSRAALKWVTLAVRPEMVSELLAAARDKNLSLILPGENTYVSGSSVLDGTTSASAGGAGEGQ